MSKITDYLLKDDVIVVMDVDGVLAPYEKRRCRWRNISFYYRRAI